MAAFFRSRPIPMASFTSVMGITALGLDWRAAGSGLHGSTIPGDAIIALAAIVFVILSIRWLQRVGTHRSEIAAEFNGTVPFVYAGAICICVSLFAAGAEPYSHALAFALWIIGTVSSALLLLFLIGRWIERGIEPAELSPALLLPVVGNAAATFDAAHLGVTGIAWFSFAFALLCWLTLLPLTIYRLICVTPRLPRKAAPQMGLLISSPAIFAAAWTILHDGAVDDVMKLLAFKSLFFALLMLRMIRTIWGEPFSVALWGWGFPLAALAGIFVRLATVEPWMPYIVIAALGMAAATIVILGCSIAAIRGWFAASVTPSAVEGQR